jgi:RNA polymerase sigma factor (sigma-70 family)
MGPMLTRARSWFPTLRGFEEDLYQAAWASLLGNSRPIDDLEKYLEAAVYSAGLKELRRRRRRPAASLSVVRLGGDGSGGERHQVVEALADRTAPLPQDQVESREETRLLVELLDELTPLQRQIIKLRWGFGFPRKEAAAFLGISEKSVKREIEKAAPLIAKNADLASAGRWCESRRSLIVAYSLGLLGPARSSKARMHLDRCPACRSIARGLNRRLDRLGAVLPLPTLADVHNPPAITGRVVEVVDSIRGGLADAGTAAKQHGLGLFARTPGAETASQVAAGGGLRGSGSAAAAVTACLIAGGSATYCAVEGVPESVRNLVPLERASEPMPTQAEAPEHQPQPVSQPAPNPALTSPNEPSQHDSVPSKAPQNDTVSKIPASPAPKDSVEFGTQTSASKQPAPAPGRASGGGEFTP